MHISKIKIENYKSFRASDDLNLKPGFNVIVGQNNAGKTALVEALSLDFSDIPHLSVVTLPTVNAPVPSNSKIKAWIRLSKEELTEVLRGGFHIAFGNQKGSAIAQKFISQNIVDDTVIISATGTHQNAHLNSHDPITGSRSIRIDYDSERQRFVPGKVESGNSNLSNRLTAVANRIYLFKAERFIQPKFTIGPSPFLKPDASNLAEVLMNLQGRNPRKFDRYIKSVQRVLPEVRGVSTSVMGGSEVEIRLWVTDTHTEREDLTVSLANSGTGIGQVLAILYVVITADHARTIIIDEPQSFLHPGAVRKLIEILKQHRHHQYIITTHSPTVVSAVDPDTITIVRLKDGESHFESVDVKETESQTIFLREVGASLSDVFGADSILWVEGPTEEMAFPIITEKVAKRSLMGTAILSVIHTGDFEGKHGKTIFEIYQKLSRGHGLLPPAIGFIFDREGRTPTQIKDLERQSKDEDDNPTVMFTPRRMFENYLLHPQAISEILSGVEGFDSQVTKEQVEEWLEDNQWEEKYFDTSIERKEEWWLNHVHGADLLNDLFQALSDKTVEFRKTEHSVELTKWIAENDPDELRE